MVFAFPVVVRCRDEVRVEPPVLSGVVHKVKVHEIAVAGVLERAVTTFAVCDVVLYKHNL